jgi:hypothetical protein
MDSLANSYIETFIFYIKEQLEMLEVGGENKTNLIPNIFKGYARAKDDTFCKWV